MSEIKNKLKQLQSKNKQLTQTINKYHSNNVDIKELNHMIDELTKSLFVIQQKLTTEENTKEFLLIRITDLNYHNAKLLKEIEFYENLFEKMNVLISTKDNISDDDATESESEVCTQIT